ncbi:MAG: DNA mismatch endonuclease Vsr [Acidobacteria bacterium]|nr:DNA mismatch endonuclease Vsr [Acidobacteriota bacterium]
MLSDTVSKEQRSRNMSCIRSRNTQPETVVRSLLHNLGYRFRLHVKTLPGKPDIVLPKFKSAIFVHGCFWHRHTGCKRCTTPRSNREYWIPKLTGNAERDKDHIKSLKRLGWKVLIVWECDVKNVQRVRKALLKFLDRKSDRIV